MRNHEPIPIKEFNGLWARGDFDSCPPNHFTDCSNVVYEQSSVQARKHFGAQYTGNIAMLRQHIFVTNVAGVQTVFLMGLGINFNFYYQKISPIPDVNPTALMSPIPGNPVDFDLVNYNGRAYITFSYATVGIIENQVTPSGILYLFNGTTFRPAGGIAPQSLPATAAVAGGIITPGFHGIGLSYETDSGFITPMNIGVPNQIIPGTQILNLTFIPLGPAGTVARRIFFTRTFIDPSQFILQRYYFIFRIPDNVTTTYTINIPDSALLEDSTYLLFILDYIPSSLGIGKYHNRLILWGFPQETVIISIINVSPPGINPIPINLTASTILFSNVDDPETFNVVTGFVIVDGNAVNSIIDTSGNAIQRGVTVCQEYRDICYIFKLTKTFAATDNGGDPSTWPVSVIDEGSGAFVKGISLVLDNDSINYEYLIISNITGMYVFNGLFTRPELTYKIADLWKLMNKTPQSATSLVTKNNFQTVLDTLNKQIYILAKFAIDTLLPTTNYQLLICDFANSFIGDPNFSNAARWGIWNFDNVGGSFKPSTLLSYDTGRDLQIICNNGLGLNNVGNNFVYWGSGTKEVLTSPFIQTNLVTDDESNIIHLGGIRYRINTFGAENAYPGPFNLSTLVINEDGTFSKQLANIVISLSPGKNPFLIANFVGQKFMIKMSVPNDGYFNLNDMIIYVKEMYSSFAQ